MAGKTGNESSTQFTCKVIRIDNEGSLPFVKGPVPDTIGGMLRIRDDEKADQGKERQKPDRPRCWYIWRR